MTNGAGDRAAGGNSAGRETSKNHGSHPLRSQENDDIQNGHGSGAERKGANW